MRLKILLGLTLMAVMILVESGCGGGGGNFFPIFGGQGTTAVSSGAITSTANGSITVNGVQYSTAGATITTNDPSGSKTLLPGMTVTVTGKLQDSTHGTASKIQINTVLLGPIASFNNLSSTMIVLNQKVKFDAKNTVFNNFSGVAFSNISGTGFKNFSGGSTSGTARLAVGQMVRVDGFSNLSSSVNATLIQRQVPDWTPASVVSVEGTVSTLTGNSLTIGNLTVNFTGITLPTGTAVGSSVQVIGTVSAINATTVTATSVVLVPGFQTLVPSGAQATLAGAVTNLSGSTFTVGGTKVNASALSLTGISNGSQVQVTGTFAGDVLIATQIANKSQFYTQTALVSDLAGAANIDANLVNPWGIARSPTGPWWVNDNGKGVTTVYNNLGQAFPVGAPLIVTVPVVAGGTSPAPPTGLVFNNFTTGFNVTPGTPSSAKFIMVTEDGGIAAWNSGTAATTVFNNFSGGTGAVYKGAALATNGSANFLYVANFRGARVDVFDTNFAPVTQVAGAFTDPTIPVGYAPFNIANIGGKLYVSYALQDAARHDDVAGRGNGFVSVYSPSGTLLMRLQSGPWMNSPWGMTLAPANFGKFSNLILVGNFGSGQIDAFDPVSGVFMGMISDSSGNPVTNSGLWGLGFGNGGTAGPTNTLFFSAGLNGEADGLFGTLTTN